MRIAHIVGKIKAGGVESVVFAYLRAVDRTGFEFDVLYFLRYLIRNAVVPAAEISGSDLFDRDKVSDAVFPEIFPGGYGVDAVYSLRRR